MRNFAQSAACHRGLRARDADRAAALCTHELVTLTSRGEPSKVERNRGFRSEAEAVADASRVRALNPGRKLRYAVWDKSTHYSTKTEI